MSALTIYECPRCGWWLGDQYIDGRGELWCDGGTVVHESARMVPVRAFREKDVRDVLDRAFHPQNPSSDHPVDVFDRYVAALGDSEERSA